VGVGSIGGHAFNRVRNLAVGEVVMDTSESYITMCEKAGEIQERAPNPKNESDWWMIGSYGDEVWLPRQDQLQDMINSPLEEKLSSFVEFCYEYGESGGDMMEYPKLFISFEQLWLSFVMKGKFFKVWIEEDWVATAKE